MRRRRGLQAERIAIYPAQDETDRSFVERSRDRGKTAVCGMYYARDSWKDILDRESYRRQAACGKSAALVGAARGGRISRTGSGDAAVQQTAQQ